MPILAPQAESQSGVIFCLLVNILSEVYLETQKARTSFPVNGQRLDTLSKFTSLVGSIEASLFSDCLKSNHLKKSYRTWFFGHV